MTHAFNYSKTTLEQKKLDEFSEIIDDITTKYQIKFENKMEDVISNFLAHFHHSLEEELASLIKKIYSHNLQTLNKYLINHLFSSNGLQHLNTYEKDTIAKTFNKISFSILESLIS
ncbi:MAG: ECH_0659 family protein [Ehrlichia sp.]